MNSKRILAFILGAAGLASAHLQTVSTPTAGQSFAPGSTVNLKWGVAVAHGGLDIAYSTNGSTWTTVATNLGNRVASYNWTVPEGLNSTTVRLRVCQRGGASVQGCTDANNSNSLSSTVAGQGGQVYVAISPVFTVSAGTGALSPAGDLPGARIRFDASVNSLDVAFPMEKAGRVTLQAFDTQGKLLVTLLDENRAQGVHRVSIHSSALDASKPMVFRLQAGDKVFQQSMEVGR
jgi:hypothetical protein